MEMLSFNYQDVKINNIQLMPNSVRVFGEVEQQQKYCICCKSHKIKAYAKGDIRIVDLPVNQKTVLLFITRKRYLCIDCNKTFFDQIKFKDKHHRMTSNLVKEIKRKFGTLSCSDLSKILAIPRRTIIDVVNEG